MRNKYHKAYQKGIVQMVQDLKAVPCTDCGVQYGPWIMQFDHRPGEVKLFHISDMTHNKGKKTILAEIAKCDVVCSNCHDERTHQRLLMEKVKETDGDVTA